jgi:hypothetical protein
LSRCIPIYITTNEFCLFGSCFNASQIYAFPKSDLASNVSSVTTFQYDTSNTLAADLPGFTVWPAQSPSVADYASQAGGTEYFLSSFAVFTGIDKRQEALAECRGLGGKATPRCPTSRIIMRYTSCLIDEQDHQIALATALGKSVPAPRTAQKE